MHVGESAFYAVVVKAEALVVEAEQVQDGGVEVVNRGDVFHRLVAELVGRAVAEAVLHAGSGEPRGEAGGVVIATARASSLESGHAAELGAPDDERVVEQTALLEVSEERGGRLVHDFPVLRVLLGEHSVSVPIAHAFAASLVGTIEELHKTHALLHEPTREDAVAGVGGLQVFHRVARLIGAIHFQNVRGLGGNVGDLGHGELHLRGEFVAGDARGEFAVAGETLKMMAVQRANEIARGGVGHRRQCGWTREIPQRFRRVEVRALKRRWEKTGAPEISRRLRSTTRVRNGDIRGERVVFAAEPVGGPCAHAGEAIEREARAHEVFAGAVRVRFAGERMDEAHLVGQRTELRNEIGNHFAALSARAELPRALVQISLPPLKGQQPLPPGHRLAVAFDEFGFVIKRVHLAHAAGAENHEHALRPRLMMRCAWCVGVCGIDLWPDRHGRGLRFATQQVRERDAAESGGGVSEEGAAIEEGMHGIRSFQVHRTKRNSLVLNIARANATAPCSRSIVTELLISNASGSRA